MCEKTHFFTLQGTCARYDKLCTSHVYVTINYVVTTFRHPTLFISLGDAITLLAGFCRKPEVGPINLSALSVAKFFFLHIKNIQILLDYFTFNFVSENLTNFVMNRRQLHRVNCLVIYCEILNKH